jgi:hypothetical protein
MAKTADAIVYKVRLANGVYQYYQIVVPASVPPAQPVKWATPSVANNQLSAQGAGIVAAAWAGGVSTRREKGGPPNSMVNVGSGTPGGFYNASSVRIDSVQLQNEPVPYYLVRMTGQIGQTRQTLYAAVLKDGRIIRPTPVSGPPVTVAVSKSGRGVGEQKQTTSKIGKRRVH